MFAGLFKTSYKKVSFEDVQFAIKFPTDFLLINTLNITEQDCLIKNSLSYELEEKTINDIMENSYKYDMNSRKIIIYGKNDCDMSVEKKFDQLSGLGFKSVYIYSGGIFEWMLLQDIYGSDEFPTTRRVLDILRYKPILFFGSKFLMG
jgi:hypothetical protein